VTLRSKAPPTKQSSMEPLTTSTSSHCVHSSAHLIIALSLSSFKVSITRPAAEMSVSSLNLDYDAPFSFSATSTNPLPSISTQTSTNPSFVRRCSSLSS
jgi:hypothetical protein